MFGFLRSGGCNHDWRRSYARICQHQRRLFGLSSLPFLSYEAAFLFQAGVDCGLTDRLPDESPRCCRLKKQRLPETESQRQAAEFCAAFGLLLAGVKLQDDVEDSGRWWNRLAAWWYSGGVRKARGILEQYAPGLTGRIGSAIEQHHQMERCGTAPQLDDYVRPTGDGFAAVYQSFALMLRPGDDEAAARFSSWGRSVGQALIAWDCAVDFESDVVRGDFNPLSQQADTARSLELCQLELSRLGWDLPAGSSAAQVIGDVSGRVRTRSASGGPLLSASVLERWGLIRSRQSVYARCDGCEVVCAGAECCGAAGEAGACCAVGEAGAETACCCFEIFACVHTPTGCCGSACTGSGDYGDCWSPRKRQSGPAGPKATAASPWDDYLGQHGTTAEVLNPSGIVSIGERRIPARCDAGGMLDENTPVVVVAADGFGVRVRRSD